jgi:hypothetical protein
VLAHFSEAKKMVGVSKKDIKEQKATVFPEKQVTAVYRSW